MRNTYYTTTKCQQNFLKLKTHSVSASALLPLEVSAMFNYFHASFC